MFLVQLLENQRLKVDNWDLSVEGNQSNYSKEFQNHYDVQVVCLTQFYPNKFDRDNFLHTDLPQGQVLMFVLLGHCFGFDESPALLV